MKKKLTLKRRSIVSQLFFAFVFCSSLLAPSLLHAQLHLVKDIDQDAFIDSSEFGSLTDVNGVLFFVSVTKELWKTDGTEAGSVKIKEFEHIYEMKKIGNLLYFFAADAGNNTALWKSDGSPGGTVKVSPKVVDGTNMTDVNGTLFFIGRTQANGLEIWKSDGTQAGTYLVKDIMKGSGNSNATSLVSFNGKLFFVANNGTNGYEVWESDGTNAGTHIFKDIIPGKTSAAPNYLTVANGILFFMARDASLGQELWKSDGTPEGTVLLKDIKAGSNSSFPDNFIAAGGLVYFRANDGANNFQLWRSDGTEAGTIKLTTTGFSWVNGKLAVGDALYYILGRTLYRSDGTVAGTQFVCQIQDFYNRKDMAQVNGSLYVVSTDYYSQDLFKITDFSVSIIAQVNTFINGNDAATGLTTSGGNVYFVGNGGDETVSKLWKTDGTSAASVVIDLITPTADSYPYRFTDVNGMLFFNVLNGISNQGLWRSDGTETGTIKLTSSSGFKLVSYNGNLFFNDFQYLRKSDGTVAGTTAVTTSFYYPDNLSVVGSTLYFRGDHATDGYELCKTDGTDAGTMVVKDIYTGNASSNPSYITDVNGIAFFTATTANGNELWKSDGTEAGTVLVKDINAGSASSSPYNLISFNNQLFFTAATPANGVALWKSDGTSEGTVLVKDINSNATSLYNPFETFKVANNKLFFLGRDDAENTLWVTDGTTEGTIKVKDFYPGSLKTFWMLSSYNNALYFLIDSNSNFDLWKSDGTGAGTVVVKKIGIDISSGPTSLAFNGHLYFDVSSKVDANSTYRRELWRTDGTACGTFLIDYQSEIGELGSAGNKLFASGVYGSAGVELLLINDGEITPPSCLPSARETVDVASENNGVSQSVIDVVHYPNPFNKSFVLHVNGKDNTSFRAKVININGMEIEQHENLKTNMEYSIGSNWNAGLYLLKIEIGGKTITKKVMKGTF
jgi:ELWxxDGT repeat protein